MNSSMQFAFKLAFLYCLFFSAMSFPRRADASEARAMAVSDSSRTNNVSPAMPTPNAVSANSFNLSPLATEIADLAGISPILKQLRHAQQMGDAKELSLASLAQKQRIVYLRGKLNSLLQAANLQISATHGRIESAMAQADELRAYITERRDRITHRNSQINLVSGGVTKMSGYSIALGNLSAIPTNVLEVFDGAVQSTLSAFALREQQKEKKLEHGMPAVLTSIFTDKQSSNQYDPGIWIYLNHVPPGSLTNRTRRELLIENWQKTGILPRSENASSQSKNKQTATIDLLDQRLAMLSDLKSEVSEMNNGLVELSNAIALSYSADPDI